MAQPHESDSTVQRQAEAELVSQLRETLGCSLKPEVLTVERCKVQIDGYYDDSERIVMAEAFARIGSPAAGQKRKVLADVLKLCWLDSVFSHQFPQKKIAKYLVFASGDTASFLTGKSWAAKACQDFGIEIRVTNLTAEQNIQLLQAQGRQKKGMRRGTKGA